MTDLPEFNVSVKMARKTGPLNSDVEYRTFSIRTPAMDADKACEAGFGLGQGVNEATDHAWKFAGGLTDDGIVVTPADDEKTDIDIDIDAIRSILTALDSRPLDRRPALAARLAETVPALLAKVDELTAALGRRDQDIRDRYKQIARLERHIAGLETQCNEQMHAAEANRRADENARLRSDKPKTWAAPAEPADVTAVHDRHGRTWLCPGRPGNNLWWVGQLGAGIGHEWHELLHLYGPLTAATDDLTAVAR